MIASATLPPRALALARLDTTLSVVGQRAVEGPLRRGEVESAQTMLERSSITLDRVQHDLVGHVPSAALEQLELATRELADARAVIDVPKISSWRLPPVGPLGSRGSYDMTGAATHLLAARDAIRGVDELVFDTAARGANLTPDQLRTALLAKPPSSRETDDAPAITAANATELSVQERAVVDNRRNGISRTVRKLMQSSLGSRLGFEVIGADKLPTTGAFLLTPVHGSYGNDLLLQLAAIPRDDMRSVAAAEAFRIPGAEHVARHSGVFPVTRGDSKSALRVAETALAEGQPLAIYPEGQVPRFDTQAEPRMGAALLALRTGRPVFPMGSYGLRPGWVTGHSLIDRLRGGTQAVGVVGDPIITAGLAPTAENIAWLTERIHAENVSLSALARQRFQEARAQQQAQAPSGRRRRTLQPA